MTCRLDRIDVGKDAEYTIKELSMALAEACWVLIEYHGDDWARYTVKELLGDDWKTLIPVKENFDA